MRKKIRFVTFLLLCILNISKGSAQDKHWTCDAYAYQYDMTAYIGVTINGITASNLSDYEIAAFCGDECRGVASVQVAEKDGQRAVYGYLRIRSNSLQGESISFRIYQKSLNKELDVPDVNVTFQSQTVVGLPSNPMMINLTVEVERYDIAFISDGDTLMADKLEFGAAIVAPNVPAKEGFSFTGWEPELPVTMPLAKQTYTAQWERNKYKLTWVVDGQATESEVLYEGAVTKPADPQKEGYTFTGWDKDIPETMPAEAVTITAQFQINQYTMTFVLDNGESNVVKQQDYGTELTAPDNLRKTGFTFKGWSPEVPATVPAEDNTFTAQWERNKYKLTWVVDGQATEIEVLYEGAVTKPEDPQKEGYTFTGWDKDIPETMPADDVTFTAQWKVNVYAIVYMVDDLEWIRDSLAYGDRIVLRDYQELGSMYEGWLFQDGENYQTMPAHDVVVIASVSTDVVLLRQEKQLVDVYDIRGRLIRRNMSITDIKKHLPSGVYIVAGRKIVIR